jgi:hypothetical protein
VAAVLGVVITMESIGGPASEIGHKVGAALVGAPTACHPLRVAPTTRTDPAGTRSSPRVRRLTSSRRGAGATALSWPANRRTASWWRTADRSRASRRP